MGIYIAIIIQGCLLYLSIWSLNKDKKEREEQYKKFLTDISELFYSVSVKTKEEE